jgi:endonuclease/exonuclease/phosphatase family metal-dependent hydrolase
MTRRRRRVLWVLAVLGVLLLLPAALFALNGLVLAHGTTPHVRQLPDVTPQPRRSEREVTVVAYNVAKGFAHRGGLKFDPKDRVAERLRRMAAVVRAENPDLVFLSEALTACGPCEIDQVELIAREVGLPHAAAGENYNVGFPGYRVAGGNAALSRFPLAPVANLDLAGRRPFWVTQNNRRALAVTADPGGGPVLLVALHNDSFDMRNNAAQMRQVLDWVGDRPAVLAGDFNNRPKDASIRQVRESGRFVGEWDGDPTFFEGDRRERIDYVFAPAGWKLVESRVVPDDTSDHRPLVCRFRLPG